MKLELGVLDVAYSGANGKSGTDTTGEVAEVLEAKYYVMETFFELRRDEIADWLAESVADEIENVMNGNRPNFTPTMAAEQKIEAEFRAFLDAGEMSKLVGSLSEGESAAFDWSKTFDSAGKRGVNHRKKAGVNKNNAARPAFIDTGLYQTSFRAWVERDKA